MTYEIDSKSVGPLTVTVSYCSIQTESPREWRVGTHFLTDIGRYNSPDEWRGDDLTSYLAAEFDVYYYDRGYRQHELETDGAKVMAAMNRAGVALPVYCYDHSGVAYQASEGGNPFHCKWDSGMVGVVYMRREDILKEHGAKIITSKIRAKVIEQLKWEVDVYSAWANGDVAAYAVVLDGETLDCCGGFIGEADYCMSEGVSAAEHLLRSAASARSSALKNLVRHKVPLHLRKILLDAAWETDLRRV